MSEEITTTASPAATETPVGSTGGKKSFIWGTGRRKTSVARVRIAPGSGTIQINDRTSEPADRWRSSI